MSRKAYFSNRIYKNTLSVENVSAIGHALFVFNQAKHFAFSTLVKEKRSGKMMRTKSLHLTVKERFQLDDYYVNSVVQEANAKLKSLAELNKLYTTNKEEQIKALKRKLKKEKSRLTTLMKIKQSFVKGKPTFPKNSREQKAGNFFVVTFKYRTDLYYHAYDFEHHYLDLQIKKARNKIGFLTFKQNRLSEELKQLKTKVSSVVFGTKKRFKSQFTLEKYSKNHNQWKSDWQKSRYCQMTISGRKDASSGNFIFHYNPNNKKLSFKTPVGVVSIEELHFPYGKKLVEAAILTQQSCRNKKKCGKPIAWSVEDLGDYFIFKCIIEEESNPFKNYSKSDGVIGVDCNVDHFAISNVNSKGQLLSSWSLPFDIAGKASNQVTKIIEAEAIELVDIAVRFNKPIALKNWTQPTRKLQDRMGIKGQTS